MSILSNLLDRFFDRPRVKISARITGQSDRPPYRFDNRVLLIGVINPTSDGIPIDNITISVDGIPWNLNPELSSQQCETPPTTIQARDRCQFWIDAIDLGEVLIREGWSGEEHFDVRVQLSTGKTNRSDPISIDLDLFQRQLNHREREQNREIRETFRRAGGSDDEPDGSST